MTRLAETEDVSDRGSALNSRTDLAPLDLSGFEDEFAMIQGWRYVIRSAAAVPSASISGVFPHIGSPSVSVSGGSPDVFEFVSVSGVLPDIESASVSGVSPDVVGAYNVGNKYRLVLGSSSDRVITVRIPKAQPINLAIDAASYAPDMGVILVEYKSFKLPPTALVSTVGELRSKESKSIREHELRKQIHDLLLSAHAEDFDADGSSDFSTNFRSLLSQDSEKLLPEVESVIRGGKVDEVVSWGILSLLGQIENVESRQMRLATLKRALSDERSRIRDGALIGLSWFDASETTQSIANAFREERNPILRNTMRRFLR